MEKCWLKYEIGEETESERQAKRSSVRMLQLHNLCTLFSWERVWTMLLLPQQGKRRGRRPTLAANWPHFQSHLNQFTCLQLRLSLQPADGAAKSRWAKPVGLLSAACCISPRAANRCWRWRRSTSGRGSGTRRCSRAACGAFPWK